MKWLTAIDRGLGHQLLEIVFYIGGEEVRTRMRENQELYPGFNR